MSIEAWLLGMIIVLLLCVVVFLLGSIRERLEGALDEAERRRRR